MISLFTVLLTAKVGFTSLTVKYFTDRQREQLYNDLTKDFAWYKG